MNTSRRISGLIMALGMILFCGSSLQAYSLPSRMNTMMHSVKNQMDKSKKIVIKQYHGSKAALVACKKTVVKKYQGSLVTLIALYKKSVLKGRLVFGYTKKDHDLWLAARNNKITEVQRLLASGAYADVNLFGVTPIKFAQYHGNEAMKDMLIAHGARYSGERLYVATDVPEESGKMQGFPFAERCMQPSPVKKGPLGWFGNVFGSHGN